MAQDDRRGYNVSEAFPPLRGGSTRADGPSVQFNLVTGDPV